MKKIDLVRIPTSEIVFYLIHCGLDKDLVNDVLTKRLRSYGLGEDEIVDLLTREIKKVKTRGEDINKYCFRINKSIEELLKIAFSAISKTDNFNNLTVSEVTLLYDMIRIIKEKYQRYINAIIKSDIKDKPYILSKAIEIKEYLDLVHKILWGMSRKEFHFDNLKSSLVWVVKEALLISLGITKDYNISLEGRENLDREIILMDDKLLNAYCPRLK